MRGRERERAKEEEEREKKRSEVRREQSGRGRGGEGDRILRCLHTCTPKPSFPPSPLTHTHRQTEGA